jgi:4-carboxymuconolactone decarboxylase
MKNLLFVALVTVPMALPQKSEAQDSHRFPALRIDQLTPDQKKWAESISAPPRNAKFNNPPYNEYIRSPAFAERATAMSDYLRWNSSLPPRLSEFAILIAARHWTQQFEWHQHYPLAIKGGLDPKILADMIVGKRPADMQEDEAVLYDLVIQLYRDKNVTDATYDAAVAKLGENGIMDVIGILGYYDMVSMTLIAAKAAPPKDDVPVLLPLPN